MINTKIKQIVQASQAQTVALRRELHSKPELPFEEFETTKRIAAELDQLGIPYRLTEPTGILADIKGGKPGKTIALRADIDALPVQELNTDLEYRSTVEGKMHACGHDAHTSMLLTAAKALNEIKADLPGNVRLIFQPAEEIAQGAKMMVKQGAIDGVDAVFGIHIWSQTPSGKVACNVGSFFASADLLKVKFKGQGGHGSMPHDAIDATIVASSFVMNLQAIVSREVDPLHPAVVTIGKMDVGTRFNVIAENAELDGTVRCFDLRVRDQIVGAIQRYADQVAATFRASAEVEYTYGTLPVINEERSALLAQSVVQSAFGADALYQERPTTGGEDFSYYMENIPGAFALVGCGNPAKDTQWAHHHGRFNVDEDTMATGAELYAQYAWAYLNQNQF